MKRFYFSALASLLALATIAAPALSAPPVPRVPQIPFNGGALQTRLNLLGEPIPVLTAQQDGLVWGSTVSSNATMTIQFALNGNPSQDEIGLVKMSTASIPPPPTDLVPLFPASADSGWFAVASFRSGGNLIVNLFNQHAALIGTTSFTGVSRTLFGYYIKNNGGTFYSHDGFNGDSKAHALAYAGTGQNVGCWWLCWEDAAIVDYANADFADAIVFMESLNPTPVDRTTWGSVKARFR